MTQPPTLWERWFRGPAGLPEILRVALPLVISSLSWTVMTFVDRMMLRWVSGDAMSAAFQANVMWFSALCLPLGICAYANSFVSQYFGDEQYRRIGPAVWQAIWFGVGCVPILLLGIPLAPMIFGWAGHEAAVTELEVIYFRALCWGSGGILISQAAATYFSGRGRTSVIMWVDALFALVNLGLDYLWIFGVAGFPEWGIAGAGYATAVSLWLKALTYVVMMVVSSESERYGTRDWGLDRELLQRLLRFGGPSGIQMMLDVVGFTVFVMLVGRLGAMEAEASSMAFSISSFAFMPVHGLGIAAGILVGQRLGENRDDLAAQSAWGTVTLGLGYMLGISLLYWLIPEFFLSGFFVTMTEGTSQADEASRQLAIRLLQFVAAYNLFDALLTIFASAIKGAGDTRFVMWTSLTTAAGLALASYLVVEVWQGGIYACWILITTWVCLLGLVFLVRFCQGRWRKMRVIEMQHTPPVEQPSA